MTTIPPTTSQAVMAAIYHAYHRADPCHCEGDAKLDEGELLAVFVKKGLIAAADTPHQDALQIDNLYAAGAMGYREMRAFKKLGITHVPEIRYWHRGHVLRSPGVGKREADIVERAAARFGILLADGNPALLEEVKQEEIAADPDWCERLARKPAGSPEEARTTCVAELLELAERMVRDGASLMRIASKIATREGAGRKAGRLRNYISHDQSGAAQVRTIAQPYLDSLEAEKANKTKPESETRTTGLRLVSTG